VAVSTDYHIRCKTCGADHHFNDANHQSDLMRALILHRDAIAALAPLVGGSDLELRTYYGTVSVSWFAEHAGHDLAVWDEYGREFPNCGTRYDCACCGKRDYCALVAGHDGPHGRAQ
jgi:hypothetical protein